MQTKLLTDFLTDNNMKMYLCEFRFKMYEMESYLLLDKDKHFRTKQKHFPGIMRKVELKLSNIKNKINKLGLSCAKLRRS